MKCPLLRTRQTPIPVVRQGAMRRQRIVRKICFPTTPFFLAGVVFEEDGDVFVSTTADRAHMPRTAKLRQIGSLLTQPVRPEPFIKLAIAQMICVFKKTMHRCQRAD